MKYSKWEKLEKPLEFGVGLSSNTLHAGVLTAEDEILMDNRVFLRFACCFGGLLVPYTSPVKCIRCCFIIKQNPQNYNERSSQLEEQID
jgi:hypothetical protein